MIRYDPPDNWIKYDPKAVLEVVVEAKSAVLSLRSIPYQKSWVETLQQMELKREVAGTSRIEGAELTERELEAAMKETPEQLHTRSQRQARAAVRTYRWISKLPDGFPLTEETLGEIHRRIVTDADDDHCPPGVLRSVDENVNFGQPRHRGVDGGEECSRAFSRFARALREEFREHDPLIQALAAHYHFAAMHPFLDGNGRTARALEALLLRKAGLRDTCFIAMSNYYYEEKNSYLKALNESREHDITPFLIFALKGVAQQSRRLLEEIQHHISKGLFRNLMYDLFNRLRSPRKRVIAERQLEILKILLDADWMPLEKLIELTSGVYMGLRKPRHAVIRDLNELIQLRAIAFRRPGDGQPELSVRLQWPTEITETAFFEQVTALPKAKTHSFLQ